MNIESNRKGNKMDPEQITSDVQNLLKEYLEESDHEGTDISTHDFFLYGYHATMEE